MMATTTKESRAEAVKQTLASWAIEGFVPDEQFVALTRRYVAGELSTEQMREIIMAQAKASVAGDTGK